MLAVHVICLKWGMGIGDKHLSVNTEEEKNLFSWLGLGNNRQINKKKAHKCI